MLQKDNMNCVVLFYCKYPCKFICQTIIVQSLELNAPPKSPTVRLLKQSDDIVLIFSKSTCRGANRKR